jgi:hypothetical protein
MNVNFLILIFKDYGLKSLQKRSMEEIERLRINFYRLLKRN